MTPDDQASTTTNEGAQAAAAAGPMHALTFDVEEYFQAEAAARAGVRREDWDSYPSRLAPRIDRILALLDERGRKATFFVLGHVAQRQGDLVRRIAAAGHEIASHGMTHTMLGRLSSDEFRSELRDSRRLLEDLAGRAVVGYRAPTFSITRQTAWALDVLAEEGFRYDSSIFPIRHDRYGIPDAPRWIHRARGPGGGEIIELPPLTMHLPCVNLPAGGGGYLRLLPYWVTALAIRKAQAAGQPAMIYMHPWELDPGQPVLPMGRLSRWRHRVHLATAAAKLARLLADFPFTSAAAIVDSRPPTLAANYGE